MLGVREHLTGAEAGVQGQRKTAPERGNNTLQGGSEARPRVVRPGNRSLALGREGSLFTSASGYQWKGREGVVEEVKLMTQEREPFKGRDGSQGRCLQRSSCPPRRAGGVQTSGADH